MLQFSYRHPNLPTTYQVLPRMDSILLNFTLTADDYVIAYRLFHNRKVNWYVKSTIYALIIFAICTGFLLWKGDYETPGWWLPYPLMVATYLVYLWAVPTQWKENVKKNPGLTKPLTWETGEEGVTIWNALIKNSYSWLNFRQLYENDKYFYLVLANDPKAYMFVPKHSFVSQEQMEQFRALCRRKIPVNPVRRY